MPPPTLNRRAFALSALAAVGMLSPRSTHAKNGELWPGLARDAFQGRPVPDGTEVLALEMPARAEDAAVVPVTIRSTLPARDTRHVKALTLIVDGNPAPVAATFELGQSAGVTGISTRVRVDSYTDVHAVAELSDGRLYAVTTFVKASGGCSAPMLKNPAEASAGIGELRFKVLAEPSIPADTSQREAMLMIRHPNNSGLQMDPVSRLYIPAYFVRELKIWQGADLVLAMTGGISLSENPHLRFTYRPNGARTFRAEVIDTKDQIFAGEWPASSQS